MGATRGSKGKGFRLTHEPVESEERLREKEHKDVKVKFPAYALSCMRFVFIISFHFRENKIYILHN